MMFLRPRAITRTLLLTAVPLLLAGCWELHQTLTVNPDGSARVRVVREVPLEAARQMQMGGDGDMEQEARDQAASIIREAQGVEAWTDVDWSVGEDALRFEGTAYVPDLTDYSLTDPASDDDQTVSHLRFRRTGSGHVVELALSDGEEGDGEPLPSLTEEEAMERARGLKSEMRRTRAMAASLFAGMREVAELRLPAEPDSVAGFGRADGAYRASVEGDSLLAAMSAVLEMETEKLADRIRRAAGEDKTQDQVMASIMGDRFGGMPARLVVPASGEPLFDYEAEVAEASESFEELKERLDLGGEGTPGAREGEAPRSETTGPDRREAGGAGAAARSAPREGTTERDRGEEAGRVEGPPELARLEVARPGLSSSLEVGTRLTVTLPAVAGERRLGLATDLPEGLSVTDDRGRELVAASDSAHEAWQAANPNTGTTRTPVAWTLTTVGDDPEVPAVEIDLWAVPSPGARTLRVRGEVPVLTPPTSTETASVPPDAVGDGAGLDLGGHPVTLSEYGTMTRGEERSTIYRVDGDVVLTAVRRGGETLWELGRRGRDRISLPAELSGSQPLTFVYGEPSVVSVPVELRFGVGGG